MAVMPVRILYCAVGLQVINIESSAIIMPVIDEGRFAKLDRTIVGMKEPGAQTAHSGFGLLGHAPF